MKPAHFVLLSVLACATAAKPSPNSVERAKVNNVTHVSNTTRLSNEATHLVFRALEKAAVDGRIPLISEREWLALYKLLASPGLGANSNRARLRNQKTRAAKAAAERKQKFIGNAPLLRDGARVLKLKSGQLKRPLTLVAQDDTANDIKALSAILDKLFGKKNKYGQVDGYENDPVTDYEDEDLCGESDSESDSDDDCDDDVSYQQYGNFTNSTVPRNGSNLTWKPNFGFPSAKVYREESSAPFRSMPYILSVSGAIAVAQLLL